MTESRFRGVQSRRRPAFPRLVAALAAFSFALAVGFCGCAGARSSNASTPASKADDGARIVSVESTGDRIFDLEIDSPAMGGITTAAVMLPVGFDRDTSRQWPVLYMLHGANTPDALTSFTRHAEFAQMIGEANVIVVTPYAGDYGYYSDWWNDGRGGPPKWETFHLVELRQLLERNYRANGRYAIAGISMGGFGAISYAARHPGMFAAAASYSGVLDTSQARWTFAPGLWGDRIAQADVLRAHNPVDVAEGLRGTKLYVSYGNGQPGPLDAGETPSDDVEANLCAMNDAFVAKLHGLGIEATITAYGAGTHTWPYWAREMKVSLPMLLGSIGAV